MRLLRFILPAACLMVALAVAAADEEIKENNPFDSEVAMRAQLLANEESTLSVEVGGRLTYVAARVGERGESGQLIASLDCSVDKARRAVVEARVKASEANLASKKKMLKFNSIGPLEVELAKAEWRAMQGELAVIGQQLKNCQLRAPFSGVITKEYVRNYQFVNRGSPIVDLTNSSELEVKVVVPSNWLVWLKPGTTFELNVDETQKKYAGEVKRLGGRIDPVSQTIEVFGKLNAESAQLLPGMSGAVTFNEPVSP